MFFFGKKSGVALRDYVMQEKEIMLCGLQMTEDLPLFK